MLPVPSPLLALPEELLTDAFALVPLTERWVFGLSIEQQHTPHASQRSPPTLTLLRRATVLPLVCRRFHRLLAASSSAWREVEWAATLRTQQSAARCGAFFSWLLPRAALLQSLTIVVERVVALELSAEAINTLQVGDVCWCR